MRTTQNKQFEKLAALNMEGLTSNEENGALWRILKKNPDLQAELVQIRSIHYLLKVAYDRSASETAFADRVQNALRPKRLGIPKLIGSIIDKRRIINLIKTTRIVHIRMVKWATAMMIIFACSTLLYQLFSDPETEFSASADAYLSWSYELKIAQLDETLTAYDRKWNPKTYGYVGSGSRLSEMVKQMNTQLTRSENLWP